MSKQQPNASIASRTLPTWFGVFAAVVLGVDAAVGTVLLIVANMSPLM